MSAKIEDAGFKFDGLKWLVVAAIVFGGAFANAYYGDDFPLLYRVIAMVALGVFAAVVAVQTERGNAFWSLLKAARVELAKVVWPTAQETHQTTVIVLVVVVITAILLWLLDMLFGYLASLIIV